MNKKGQSVASEYMLIFFVVVAAAVAMTVYVQRGLEARIHDARNFMINAVTSSGACDASCVNAAGGVVTLEYEPYYAAMLSDVQHGEIKNSEATTGNPLVMGAVYRNTIDDTTNTVSISSQLPPCASANPIPSWCQ